MKLKIIPGFFIFVGLAVSSSHAQEFTLTTTSANTVSSKSSIDLPGLTGNPLAIIVATPLGDTQTLNPHPIGAWYYSGKWNIFNTDHAVMPLGAKYKVQFFLKPGPNQFLHSITQQNLGSEGSYIDHPALNNNPNAQFKILQNHAPDVRSPYKLNMFEAKASYSDAAGRWYIANVNGEPLGRGSAYNIVINTANEVSANTKTDAIKPTSIVPDPAPAQPTASPVDNTGRNDPTPRPTPLPVSTPTPLPVATPLPTSTALTGFVDMHTHPMSHLGFGKKLLHGAPDVGSIIPAGTRLCNPTDFRANNIYQALGNCNSTHGGWGTTNVCGDHVRALVISSFLDKDFAYRVSGNAHNDHRHEGIETHPNFLYFPHQTSKVHQQMWWEWIERAHKEGKLNVMVALAVNNELLAELISGDAPKDDKSSADLQIDEIKSFVGRHDFMEIAYSASHLRRIVGEGKLAVVLGMEVDNIGNFHRLGANETLVKSEIQRLYVKGVRYVFPIHLLDNKFGGTAVYSDLFNFANKYSTGSFYDIRTDFHVDFKLGVGSGFGGDYLALQGIKSALDAMSGLPSPPAFNGDPNSPDFCPVPILGCSKTFRLVRGLLTPDPGYLIYSTKPGGHVNAKGLSDLGKVAVKEMMKLGMLIDIDHMSDLSQDDTLKLAEQFSYPVNIGHNGIRGWQSSERHASIKSIKRVAALGGVFGVGTADTTPQAFIERFVAVWTAMGTKPAVAIGTDVNGMEPLPKASTGLNSANFYNGFPKSKTGNRTWDYTIEGVAHYGLMADFMRDVSLRNSAVYNNLMNSAEYFAQMWEKVERQKTTVK